MKFIDDIIICSGDITLTSGKKSDFYIDIKSTLTKRDNLREIALAIGHGNHKVAEGITVDLVSGDGFDIREDDVPMISLEPGDVIAGVAMGGVPIAVAISMECWNDYAIVRSKDQEHGTGGRIIGDVEGKHVFVVEDVTTTGNSMVSAIRALREAGAIVRKAVAVVDRGEGAVRAINREDVLFAYLYSAKDIMDPDAKPDCGGCDP